jgi:TusA-related sulfurtransferase
MLVKLDVRGSSCPMPLVRLAKAIEGLHGGGVVEIVGDDPIFELGVREFCVARGLSVEHQRVEGRDTHLTVRMDQPGDGA